MSEPVADVAPNVSVVSLDSAFGFCVFCWTPRTIYEAPGAVEGLLIRLSFVLVASALVALLLCCVSFFVSIVVLIALVALRLLVEVLCELFGVFVLETLHYCRDRAVLPYDWYDVVR